MTLLISCISSRSVESFPRNEFTQSRLFYEQLLSTDGRRSYGTPVPRFVGKYASETRFQVFCRDEQHVRDGYGRRWRWDGTALSSPSNQLPLQQVRPHLPQVRLGCSQVRLVLSLKQVRPDQQVRLVESAPSSTSLDANLNGSRGNCLRPF